jgi:hypothetical protein
MSEFEITDDKLKTISQQFKVEINTVKLVHNIFTNVIKDVKNQYLAHIIRCMESFLRKKTGNPLFQINCYSLDPNSRFIDVGCAQYFQKQYFTIFFHPKMSDKQLRVCLAHELGHLFLIELLNDLNNKGETFDQSTLTEPISSIFGVFTVMEKNDFYKNQISNIKLNHNTWDDIVKDFIQLYG